LLFTGAGQTDIIGSMYQPLVPCPACDRHVMATETTCPFCSTALPDNLSERVIPGAPRRLGRAAAFVFGASLAVTGCSDTTNTGGSGGGGGAGGGAVETDGGVDDDGGVAPLYGDPPPPQDAGPNDDGGPVPLYGAPPLQDAGPSDDGGGAALYGLPPFDAGP